MSGKKPKWNWIKMLGVAVGALTGAGLVVYAVYTMLSQTGRTKGPNSPILNNLGNSNTQNVTINSAGRDIYFNPQFITHSQDPETIKQAMKELLGSNKLGETIESLEKRYPLGSILFRGHGKDIRVAPSGLDKIELGVEPIEIEFGNDEIFITFPTIKVNTGPKGTVLHKSSTSVKARDGAVTNYINFEGIRVQVLVLDSSRNNPLLAIGIMRI